MLPDLSVIIVAYHCRDELAACLQSLAPSRVGVSAEVFVVDNASRDGTAEMVRERFGWVHLVANAENRGFAAANNQAIVSATGRHVLFLNPDTAVSEGALETLVRTLDGDPTIGACGPRIVNPDGTPQHSLRRFPTFTALLHQYTILRAVRLFKPAYRRYKMANFTWERPADVDCLMGAALCVPREVLSRVGTLDERFFVYLEEMDLCRRLANAGYRVRFVPGAEVTHVGGVSAKSGPATVYFFRSLFAYLRKHRGRAVGSLMAATLMAGMFLRHMLLFPANALAGLLLLVLAQRTASARHIERAYDSARFLVRDGWLMMLKNP